MARMGPGRQHQSLTSLLATGRTSRREAYLLSGTTGDGNGAGSNSIAPSCSLNRKSSEDSGMLWKFPANDPDS